MSTSMAYYNGSMVPAHELAIPIHDAGVVWGAIITERIRTYNGQLFRLEEHLQRLHESCALAHIPPGRPIPVLADISTHLVTRNRADTELAVLWLVTPGPDPRFLPKPPSHSSPTLIGYTLPIDPVRATRRWREGVGLLTSTATVGVDPRIKHRSRLAWWIGSPPPGTIDVEAIFVDPQSSFVRETPTSNVVAAIKGQLVAPPAGQVLEGISLEVIQELADQIGVEFVRRELPLDELLEASEVFLTNTTDGLVGVKFVAERRFPCPGPKTQQLRSAFDAHVADVT